MSCAASATMHCCERRGVNDRSRCRTARRACLPRFRRAQSANPKRRRRAADARAPPPDADPVEATKTGRPCPRPASRTARAQPRRTAMGAEGRPHTPSCAAQRRVLVVHPERRLAWRRAVFPGGIRRAAARPKKNVRGRRRRKPSDEPLPSTARAPRSRRPARAILAPWRGGREQQSGVTRRRRRAADPGHSYGVDPSASWPPIAPPSAHPAAAARRRAASTPRGRRAAVARRARSGAVARRRAFTTRRRSSASGSRRSTTTR